MSGLRLSIKDVSGSTILSGTLNGNFSQICESLLHRGIAVNLRLLQHVRSAVPVHVNASHGHCHGCSLKRGLTEEVAQEVADILTLAENNWKYKVVSTEETSASSSTSSLTSRLSFLQQRTATRRGLADPILSPMLAVFGIGIFLFHPPSSPWPRVSVLPAG